MPTTYTSLLGLALPTTGELAGTWGTTVNDYITQYVDAAVAGAQTISGTQTAVTLSTTNGGALTSAGSGATGSAQYAIINCTGNPGSQLTVTAPAASKVYLVLNNTSTNQSVKVVGVGPTTGVTVAAGQCSLIAWNGSDFEVVASTDVAALQGLGTGVATALAINANATGGFPTTDGTATLTNKRVTPRSVVASATSGNLTINGDTTDQYEAEGLTGAITFLQPSGTPTDGQKLMIRIKDNGTARGITWTTSSGAFRAVGITLPTTTVLGKVTYVGCVYNATDSFWDAVATVTQA